MRVVKLKSVAISGVPIERSGEEGVQCRGIRVGVSVEGD